MNCDAFCTKSFSVQGGFQHIGVIAATAVSQGSKLVDIYTKLCHAAKVTGSFWV